MPPILPRKGLAGAKPSVNGNAGTAANSPSPGGNVSLAARLRERLGPDQVKIGSSDYTATEDDTTGSWEELAAENQRVRYLLKGWVPYSMLTGLVGEPKVGKSAFALWGLVRPVITGRSWFTHQLGAPPGYAVWCDTEHRAAVNLDRAAKWGLPVRNILTPFKDRREVVNIDNPEHIKRITAVVNRYKAGLVVVDSYRGAHARDENNSTIAVGLQALGGICEETGVACVVLHHAKKMQVDEDLTINCGRGSNAFLAAVACQIAIDRPDPKSDWRRVQVLGENLGIAPPPAGFRVTHKGLEFGQAPTRPAKEKRESGADRAEEWLRGRMKPNRWYPAGEVIKDAEALGFSHTGTLQRAKAALRVRTRKTGKGHEWFREDLPGSQGNS